VDQVKDLVLRRFGDEGAETIERYWAQIEYTVYWCVSMMLPSSGICYVVPEWLDDVIIERDEYYELHQVKCRDQSQQPWTTAEVLPILCQQYSRRKAFDKQCQFHFVSDHVADNKTRYKPGSSLGSLYRLRYLLDIKHSNQTYEPDELSEFNALEKEVIRRIRERMHEKHGESGDEKEALALLRNTWIETKSPYIRNRPSYDELSGALQDAFPGQPACAISQLQETWVRIALLVLAKIITGKTLSARRISREEVLNCRWEAVAPENGLPDLSQLPGVSPAEKKALFGGFDSTEMPVFVTQRLKADQKKRRLDTIGMEEALDDLMLALMTLQHECRSALSNPHSNQAVGPGILEMLRPKIRQHLERYFPQNKEIDEAFCQGLVWQMTNDCLLWWHNLHPLPVAR
jgi:hypothetical protein